MRNAPSGLRLDWIERWLWREVCPSHAEAAGCRKLQQSRQAGYDRLTALPRWSRRGECLEHHCTASRRLKK